MDNRKNKNAVILMAHGSRVPGAGEAMEKVACRLSEYGHYDMVEICYMSRLGPHFEETLEKCVKQGAKTVVLIPYFLNSGLHMKLDIPVKMKKESEKYPDIKLIFGKNLGFDELLVEIVKKRIEESLQLCDVRKIDLEPRDRYKLPPEELEYVAMSQEEAKRFKAERRNQRKLG